MARDEFLSNVRGSVVGFRPSFGLDQDEIDPEEMSRTLRRKPSWLGPGTVEGFDLRDFEDLAPDRREALARDVADFSKVAAEVAANGPPTASQVDAALPPLLDVMAITGEAERAEWLRAARALIEQVRGWIEARDWPLKVYPRTHTEHFIGTYELDRLVFAVEGSQIVFKVVARFVPTTRGMFEIAVMPTYDTIDVFRDKKRSTWFLRPTLRLLDRKRAWSEAAFVDAAERLARLV